jgi:hypothetical protein
VDVLTDVKTFLSIAYSSQISTKSYLQQELLEKAEIQRARLWALYQEPFEL